MADDDIIIERRTLSKLDKMDGGERLVGGMADDIIIECRALSKVYKMGGQDIYALEDMKEKDDTIMIEKDGKNFKLFI